MSEHFYEVTREELLARAEKLAQESSLRTDARTALTRIRAGELAGTMLASELESCFFLLGDYD